MIRKDYFLKMLEDFFQALAKILKLKNEGNSQQAQTLINEQMQRHLKWDVDLVKKMSKEELLINLQNNENLQVNHWTILGDLLQVESEILLENAEIQSAKDLLIKALAIFELIKNHQSHIFSFELESKIQKLQNSLEDLEE